MRNQVRQTTAMSGVALIALVIGASVPALADGIQVTTRQQAHQHQYEQMQARMQTMQALMNQIYQTTDPAARQKLMDRQYELMHSQMSDMGAMHGCMMGHDMPDHGMAGQHMMSNGMMQPGAKEKTD